MIAIKIYLICVIAGLLYPVFQRHIAKALDIEGTDPYLEAPLLWRFLSCFVPLVNLMFLLSFILWGVWFIEGLWFLIGHNLSIRLGRSVKHFFLKEWTIRTFFKNSINTFYDRLEKTSNKILPDSVLKRILSEIIKKEKDEKEKDEH